MNFAFASLFLLHNFAPVARAAGLAAPGVAADKELVSVNGFPIRQSDLMDRILKRYGAQTLDEMIDETLLRQAVAKKGVKATDAEVSRRVDKLQAQFGSRELFLSQLEQAGSSLSKLKQDLGDEISREKLITREKSLSVSDDELRKAFDEHKDSLGQQPAIHLRHLLVKTQAEADDAVSKIRGGADFGEIARAKSLAASGKATGGDYGFVSRGMLPPTSRPSRSR